MLTRIGIHLSNDDTCPRRISVGVQLAKVHGAEVVGVHPVEDSSASRHDPNAVPQISNQLMHAAHAAGVKADWRSPQGKADEALALHSRFCDVLIMSKTEPNALMSNLPEAVVMAAGRPVLMLPTFGDINTIGRHVLLCWDQRREAARAFADAAPFLKECETLTILEIDRDNEKLGWNDLRKEDISHYCQLLGYPTPKRLNLVSTDYGVGNVILNAATDTGCDLIVMGAYGHSRMREWVMGGASRTLLSSMTVPVLLTH